MAGEFVAGDCVVPFALRSTLRGREHCTKESLKPPEK